MAISHAMIITILSKDGTYGSLFTNKYIIKHLCILKLVRALLRSSVNHAASCDVYP